MTEETTDEIQNENYEEEEEEIIEYVDDIDDDYSNWHELSFNDPRKYSPLVAQLIQPSTHIYLGGKIS